jgi:hypothetical protein
LQDGRSQWDKGLLRVRCHTTAAALVVAGATGAQVGVTTAAVGAITGKILLLRATSLCAGKNKLNVLIYVLYAKR